MQDNQAYYMKEGQTQGAIAAVISLIVGVGVSVLILIFVGVLGGQAYNIAESNIDEIGNNVVTGESFTILNTTTQLGHNFIQEGTLSVYNITAPFKEWGLANFTIDYADGSLLPLALDGIVNNSVLGTNYTWGAAEIRTGVKNSIVSGFEALENTGEYLPLIVLGIVIFIVLGLVLGMTAFSGGMGGGSSAL